MSALKDADSKKWINALVAIGAALTAYMTIAFLGQLSDWFELEAKITNFETISQVAGIVVGALGFVFILKSKSSYKYLTEVYGELTKVIWPDKDSTLKLTVGIIVGIALSALVLGLIDFGIKKVLELLY